MIPIPSFAYANPELFQFRTDQCIVYHQPIYASNYSVMNPMSLVEASSYFSFKCPEAPNYQQLHSISFPEPIDDQNHQIVNEQTLQSYCMCEQSICNLNSNSYYKIESDPSIENVANVEKLSQAYHAGLTKTSTKSKSKKLLLEQRIEGKIPKIFESLHLICDEDSVLISGKPKLAPRGNSNRRSAYIGVFKNGPNWQSLISIDKKKTYIGTYLTEIEAARAFDYYSILLHGLTAVTNLDYSKRDILELITENQAD